MIQSKISKLLLLRKNCLNEVFCFSRVQKEVTHTTESKSVELKNAPLCIALHSTLFMPFLLFQHDETETGP